MHGPLNVKRHKIRYFLMHTKLRIHVHTKASEVPDGRKHEAWN